MFNFKELLQKSLKYRLIMNITLNKNCLNTRFVIKSGQNNTPQMGDCELLKKKLPLVHMP